MILIIDNYDSFTYNLVQYVGETGVDVMVFRNDKITLDEIRVLDPIKIILSPGPGTPSSSGICTEIVKSLSGEIPILGVCLGHQVIGDVFGAQVDRASRLLHGKTSKIFHDSQSIYRGVPNPFTATRYHSLEVKRENFPSEILITAETADNTIMGIRHRTLPVEGVQFHPESIMTENGRNLILNFIGMK